MRYSYIFRMPDGVRRPVRMDDAEFIVRLRNQPHAKGCINDTPVDVERQREWLREYFKRENEYYWIAETLDGKRFGTVSLYNCDLEKRQIETGRWVRMADAPQNNMIAWRVLERDFVFNVLGMERLVYDVVSTNKPVLKLHRMCGAVESGTEKEKFEIQGKKVDLVWFEETKESFAKVRPRLCRLAGIPEDRPYGTIEKVLADQQ